MNNDNNPNELENKIKEMQTSIEKIHDLIIKHLDTKPKNSEEYQRFRSYLTYISEILKTLRQRMESK